MFSPSPGSPGCGHWAPRFSSATLTSSILQGTLSFNGVLTQVFSLSLSTKPLPCPIPRSFSILVFTLPQQTSEPWESDVVCAHPTKGWVWVHYISSHLLAKPSLPPDSTAREQPPALHMWRINFCRKAGWWLGNLHYASRNAKACLEAHPFVFHKQRGTSDLKGGVQAQGAWWYSGTGSIMVDLAPHKSQPPDKMGSCMKTAELEHGFLFQAQESWFEVGVGVEASRVQGRVSVPIPSERCRKRSEAKDILKSEVEKELAET